MSQFVDGAERTYTAGAALAQFLRVKLSSGKLAACAAHEAGEGVLQRKAFADGDKRAVRLFNASGTMQMVASAAITAGALVYGAASGKISSTANGVLIGRAMEEATADDDIIEVRVFPQPDAAAHIADPAGGGTADAEARTAIDAILVVLENAGLTRTS